MDRDAHLILEAYEGRNEGTGDVKAFIDYFKKRTEEIAEANGHKDSAVGQFMFDFLESGDLGVMCDVTHSDTVLGSLSPEVVGTTSEQIDAFIAKYDIANYIPVVLKALEEAGVDAEPGLRRKPFQLGPRPGLGVVSVNDYTGDTLTVQLDIKNFKTNFTAHRQEYAQVIDAFVGKVFKVIKLLETKYFKPQPFTPPPEA